MYLAIDPFGRPEVTLHDPADFTALAVVILAHPSDLDLGAMLRQWGLFDGTHAWLHVQRLEDELGRRLGDDPQWPQRFTAMLDYALAHGWLDEHGTTVRAHVRWQPPTTSEAPAGQESAAR
ncbi:hypothetical protein ACFROC_22840 [Nocardia tengchongensis]|uniref:hypothetical protein n=1 Tax=Nocardia tengchongensis TaxID=2055889 RepID=UPI0036A8F40A